VFQPQASVARAVGSRWHDMTSHHFLSRVITHSSLITHSLTHSLTDTIFLYRVRGVMESKQSEPTALMMSEVRAVSVVKVCCAVE
jgi:hypothetical protein